MLVCELRVEVDGGGERILAWRLLGQDRVWGNGDQRRRAGLGYLAPAEEALDLAIQEFLEQLRVVGVVEEGVEVGDVARRAIAQAVLHEGILAEVVEGEGRSARESQVGVDLFKSRGPSDQRGDV